MILESTSENISFFVQYRRQIQHDFDFDCDFSSDFSDRDSYYSCDPLLRFMLPSYTISIPSVAAYLHQPLAPVFVSLVLELGLTSISCFPLSGLVLTSKLRLVADRASSGPLLCRI